MITHWAVLHLFFVSTYLFTTPKFRNLLVIHAINRNLAQHLFLACGITDRMLPTATKSATQKARTTLAYRTDWSKLCLKKQRKSHSNFAACVARQAHPSTAHYFVYFSSVLQLETAGGSDYSISAVLDKPFLHGSVSLANLLSNNDPTGSFSR